MKSPDKDSLRRSAIAKIAALPRDKRRRLMELEAKKRGLKLSATSPDPKKD